MQSLNQRQRSPSQASNSTTSPPAPRRLEEMFCSLLNYNLLLCWLSRSLPASASSRSAARCREPSEGGSALHYAGLCLRCLFAPHIAFFTHPETQKPKHLKYAERGELWPALPSSCQGVRLRGAELALRAPGPRRHV